MTAKMKISLVFMMGIPVAGRTVFILNPLLWNLHNIGHDIWASIISLYM